MKRTIIIALIAAMVLTLAGCNYGGADLNVKYDTAMIAMPDGTTITGKMDKWWNYDNELILVEIDGTVYLTHSCNVVLVKEGAK